MNKQLIVFLLILGALIAGMAYYHLNTASPFDSPVFFGH